MHFLLTTARHLEYCWIVLESIVSSSLNQLFAQFFIYAILGWILEVVYCSVKEGKFTNRGFLAGPWCPIYGFGGLLMVHLLTPLEHSAALIFLGAMVIASGVELVGGWLLEKIFHQRWWEYDDMPFNLGGYICLAYSMAWGLGGVIVMRVLHPAVMDTFAFVPAAIWFAFNCVLFVVVGIDLAASIQAALKLSRELELLNLASSELQSLTDKWSETIGTSAIDLHDDAEKILEKATTDVGEARRKLEDLAIVSRSSERLLNAFPSVRLKRHAEALEIIQQAHPAARHADIQSEEAAED